MRTEQTWKTGKGETTQSLQDRMPTREDIEMESEAESINTDFSTIRPL